MTWEYKGKIDPKRCIASVTPNERGARSHQCRRKRKVGKWCTTHAPQEEPTDDTPQLYVVHKGAIVSLPIAADTAKQIRLYKWHAAVRDRLILQKKEDGSPPGIAAYTQREAAELNLSRAERDHANCVKRLVKARRELRVARDLLSGLGDA